MRYILITAILFAVSSCKNRVQDQKNNESGEVPLATIPISAKLLSGTDTILSKYYQLKNAFVEADSFAIQNAANAFSRSMIDFDQLLEQDSLQKLSNRSNVESIHMKTDSLISNFDMTQKRRFFSSLSDSLFSLIKQLQYSGKLVYWQKCPMAFNDTETAHWLSPHSDIENPYLGKKHPKYGAGMLHCGEIVDSVNYRR